MKINTFIAEIEKLLIQKRLTIVDAKELIGKYQFLQDDFIGLDEFDHPMDHSYGRTLIWKENTWELMLMSWNPGDYSMIHDHGGAQLGVVQIFGELTHSVYNVNQLQINKLKEEVLMSGEILGVTNDMIHQMGNESNKKALSLHFYYSPNESEKITANTRLYDVANERVILVDGGAFYALPEEGIKEVLNGLTSNSDLFQQENDRLKSRIQRINDGSGSVE